MKIYKLITALLLLLASTHSYAFTVQEFINKCDTVHRSQPNESPQQTVNRALDAGSCSGYVGGVINGVNLVGNLMIKQKLIPNNFICLPKNKLANELLSESVIYMKKSKEIRNAPAQLGIYNALATAYPCEPRQNNPK